MEAKLPLLSIIAGLPDPQGESITPDLFRMLAAEAPAGVLVTSAARDLVLYCNGRAAEMWGLSEAAALDEIGERMRELAADPNLVSTLWAQRSMLAGGETSVVSYLLLRDGRQVAWRTTVFSEADGTEGGELHLFEDISPRRGGESGVRAAEDLFRLTFEKAAVGMTLVSSDFRFLRANPSLCRVLGYEERELLELRVCDVSHPDEPMQEGEWNDALREGHEAFHVDRRFVNRQGETLWLHLSVSVVRDAAGRPVFFIAMAEDITRQKRVEAEREQRTRELATLANTDPLTGLFNHRHMQERLAESLAEARDTGHPVSVLMLDLDHFRELNERFGHDAGDRALRTVADCMRHSLREGDVACRYGGEEFVIILAGAAFPDALAAAERVRRRLARERPVISAIGPVTCSAGVATYPSHASTAASLLKAADVALYEAKRSGRNRVCGYEPAPFECPPDHLESLQSALQGASLEAVNALVTAIDLRDRYTGAHCQRVGRLSVELAQHLGLPEAQIDILRVGASLLDVGKIGLPDFLLTKPGRLTNEEWELMRQHPAWGEQLVRRSALPQEVVELVRWHHERLDGSGYPDGLRGAQIPDLVRVVHVADVASALLDDRPYRRAWPRERVVHYLRRLSGIRLDARVVEAFCELYPHSGDAEEPAAWTRGDEEREEA